MYGLKSLFLKNNAGIKQLSAYFSGVHTEQVLRLNL